VWLSRLGVGQGVTTPTIKNYTCHQLFNIAFELDGLCGTALENGCDIWNVNIRNLYRAGSLETVTRELRSVS
jgi:hypothetical protein